MTFNDHKQHKIIHKLDERITAVESIVSVVAELASIMLAVVGFLGFVFTLVIDKVRGRLFEWGWLQVAGLFAFGTILILGCYMLWEIRNKKEN